MHHSSRPDYCSTTDEPSGGSLCVPSITPSSIGPSARNGRVLRMHCGATIQYAHEGDDRRKMGQREFKNGNVVEIESGEIQKVKHDVDTE